jgi:hypothetical protein
VLFCFQLFAPAQRGIFHKGVSLGQMDTQVFLAQLTVEDILKRWPQAFSVFRSRNTDCVGCLLQRFCSLKDVAEAYDVELQDLINDLEKCIRENY